MHHGVEGNTIPHTGPKAFAAMKQDEARKQSTTTPQALGKATGPSHEATRYPEGGTSTVTPETQTERNDTEEPQQERNQKEKKQTEGKESTAQKSKNRSGRGTGPPKGEQKTPQSNSKWEQITKRCQGTSGTGTEQV